MASVQAVTRVNAEQSSKRTMHGPTRQPVRGRLEWLGKRAMEAPSRRAGVVAMACTREENARNTGSPIAWSVVTANLGPVTVGQGAMGWRRGPYYRGGRVMPAEGRGLGSRLVLKVAKHGRLGQPYRTPLMCESCGRRCMPKRREDLGVGPGSHSRPQVVVLAVASNRVDRSTLGRHGSGGWSAGCS